MRTRNRSPHLILTLLLAIVPVMAGAQTYNYDAAGRLTGASYANGSSISYEYDANGNVTRIARRGVAVSLPPDGMIDTPAGDVTINAGQSVNFTGTGTDPDGALPLTYRWDFAGGAAESNVEDPGAVTFANAGTFKVEFHVTDATGLSDPTPASVVVTVNAVSGSGGSGNTGNSGNSGGGSVFWLPLILLCAACYRRWRRLRVAAVLMAAGVVQAATWAPMDSRTMADLNDVWGASPDAVYAVGNGGTILLFDGTAWTPMDSGTGVNLNGVYGYATNDVYAVGDSATILHYDGSTWSPFAGPNDETGQPEAGNMVDVWTAGPGNDLYVITSRRAYYWDGAAWNPRSFSDQFSATLTPDTVLESIHGTATGILVVGRPFSASGGEFYANFREVSLTSSTISMHGAFALDDNDMFIVGDLNFRFQGGNIRTSRDWSRMGAPMTDPVDVWASSGTDVYVVGSHLNAGRIAHYDGNVDNLWDAVYEVPLTALNAVIGFSATDIFVVGNSGTILRFFELPPPDTAANFPYSGMLSPHVNAYTGELILTETDLRRGHAAPVEFERYYASGLRHDPRVGGSLGRNWTHTYEWTLQVGLAEVTVINNRGRHFRFAAAGLLNWALVAPVDRPFSLTETDSEFLFADPDSGKIYRFSKFGNRLVAIDDRNGNRVSLTYSAGLLVSASDLHGNVLAFQYNGAQQLVQVYTDGASTSPDPRYDVDFTYANGNLATVTDPGGRVTSYEYVVGRETDGLLHAVHLPLSTDRRWIYDDQDRVTAMLLTDGGEFLYSYGVLSTDVTHPDGTTSSYSHDDNGALLRHDDGTGNVDTWTYDQDGRIATHTDRVGRTTAWQYAGGSFNVSSVTGADGQSVDYTWVMNSSDAGIAFYDNSRIDYPDGTAVQFAFDGNGNTTSFTDQLGNIWSFTYDAAGNVLTATDPLGGLTQYRYQEDGALREITDSAGNLTFRLYDGYRRPTGADFADNTRLLLTWNARGDIERIDTPAGDTINYTYNADGRLSQVLTADGGVVDITYSAGGNVLERKVGNANATSFAYDDSGRVRAVTKPDGASFSYVYDEADRLVAFLDEANRTWAVDYDANGMPRAVRMPNGDRIDFDNTHVLGLVRAITAGPEQVTYQYDVMNRITGVTDALENVAQLVRDSRGLVTESDLAALQISARFQRNALGQVTMLVDPNGNEWRSGYDAANRLSRRTDPLGNETQYAYDSMNRMSRVTYPAGSGTQDISYGNSGHAIRRQYSDGTDIQLDFDAEGEVVGGSNLTIAYEPNGNMGSSNGIGISYDANDRISRITLAPNRFVDYTYNARGDLIRVTDWAGGITDVVPDERGRIASITRPDKIQTSYTYDRAARISSITYGAAGSISLQRDALGRVSSAARDLPGPSNVEPGEQNFAFNAASQVEGFDYDVQGNLLSDGNRSYSYDLAGHLTGYDGTNGRVSLAYDALGRRISSQGPGGNRSYVYNYALSDARVGIEREDGRDLWYYVHTSDGRLLYRIDASGNRQHYYFDEMGNTVFMTNDAGDVIQSYFVGPQGEVLDSLGQVDNDVTLRGEFGDWRMRDTENLVSVAGHYTDVNSLKPLTRDLQESENPLEVNPYKAFLRRWFDRGDLAAAREIIERYNTARPGARRIEIPGFAPKIEALAKPVPSGAGPSGSRTDASGAREVEIVGFFLWAFGNAESILGRPVRGMVMIKPPGFDPRSTSTPPDPVDSILKEVGVTLVRD